MKLSLPVKLIVCFCLMGLVSCGSQDKNSNNTTAEALKSDGKKETQRAVADKDDATRDAIRSTDFSYNDAVVYAVNVGGDAYTAADGLKYRPDDAGIGGRVAHIPVEDLKGSQNNPLFASYRLGDIHIKKPLPNGKYDIIFKFAEPDDIEVGERIFSIVAEDVVVLENLDVKLARDGKSLSGLDKAVTDVEITDGQLDISFIATKNEALLSAIVVRKKFTDERNWELVWSDEFDYEGKPDSNKWTHDIWPARKVNDEDQTYTDHLRNARVENGRLIIEAHKENYNNAEYTSGRIHSQGKGDLLYGKIDVRARLPAGQGTWAAIWMLPSDPFKYASTCEPGEDWQGSETCDAWPSSGEIDIMEHVGYDMNVVHGTVHNRAYYWKNWEQRKSSVESKNAETEFHVYSLEWDPEKIVVLFNGVPYFFYMNQGEGWEAWPYDHAYHLILNLAIGGGWGRAGGPIDDSIFPVRMEVDYVRMYQLQ